MQVHRIVSKSKQKQKRNVNDVTNIIEGANAEYYINNSNQGEKQSLLKRMGINITTRITTRDLVIFTQDLYLLKKANFNNIHALSTIVETTENDQLREIIKDIFYRYIFYYFLFFYFYIWKILKLIF